MSLRPLCRRRPTTALQLADAFDGGADPIVTAREALERARSEAPGAFISLCEGRAFAEAAASRNRRQSNQAASRLDGVPVAWKDVFDIAQTRTTAGAALRCRAPVAERDAAAVMRLSRAGLVTIGKTNLSEFAFSGIGLNPHFGTPVNPWSRGTDRVPGGSSSGAAVAVAAGIVPCAVGTDTSGSVRVPAAFCGLVGFKPTSTRIDRNGVFPLAPTLDTVGPIAHSVADVATLYELLAGAGTSFDSAGDPQPSLVVPVGELVADADDDVNDCFERVLASLTDAHVAVAFEHIQPLEEAQSALDQCGTLVAAEAARAHAGLMRSPLADLLDPRVLQRLKAGSAISQRNYDHLLKLRGSLSVKLGAALGRRILVYPTVRHTAPSFELDRDPFRFAEVNARTLRNTMLTSYLDLPSLSLPCGLGDDGLPIGLHLASGPRLDAHLLQAAHWVEALLSPPYIVA